MHHCHKGYSTRWRNNPKAMLYYLKEHAYGGILELCFIVLKDIQQDGGILERCFIVLKKMHMEES
uniref:Uncharacterized protein n=1 Tax=Picea sitchensis TaxID=3332 RepID=A9NSP2_PICSI|nr:unknown [Picea sitchensis]